MDQYCLDSSIQDLINMSILQNCFPLNDNFRTFDRNDFSCVFINKILNPGPNHPCSQYGSYNPFKSSPADFDFLGKPKYL